MIYRSPVKGYRPCSAFLGVGSISFTLLDEYTYAVLFIKWLCQLLHSPVRQDVGPLICEVGACAGLAPE